MRINFGGIKSGDFSNIAPCKVIPLHPLCFIFAIAIVGRIIIIWESIKWSKVIKNINFCYCKDRRSKESKEKSNIAIKILEKNNSLKVHQLSILGAPIIRTQKCTNTVH
jgi:hypothetical protein